MGGIYYAPEWLRDVLVRDPSPPPPHWVIRIGPLAVMLVVALVGLLLLSSCGYVPPVSQ